MVWTRSKADSKMYSPRRTIFQYTKKVDICCIIYQDRLVHVVITIARTTRGATNIKM